ncbi:MAG: universal stress protein [Planctomycetes bacterium]|nr:universal stress protein [Planctomycetota bacterium]
MFERILIPLDGSPRAELILSQVARILHREDSEILLLRVVDVPTSVGRVDLTQLRNEEREGAQRYLHDMTRRFANKSDKVHARIAEGSPADVILETARTEGATLIAMSTHGRSGVARWALGSVAEKVARAADVPVLLVRSFRRSSKGDLEPIVPEELPFRRILVPVDGSVTSMSVIGPTEKFAQLYGSDILTLHVLPPFVAPSPVLPGMEAGVPLMRPEPLPSEKDEVTAKAAERFRQAGLNVSRLTVEGEPASEILDLSTNRGMDLIALGTHGRSGVSRWALGSVAERVLRSTEVPLLLVRTPSAGKRGKKAAAEKEHAHG